MGILKRYQYRAKDGIVYDNDFFILFENYIKDTVEDELADIVIRTLSFIEHYDIHILLSDDEFKDLQKQFLDNKPFDLEDIVGNMFICNYCRNYMMLIALIEAYCEYAHIDLHWHIDKKRKYNEIRDWE